MIDKKLGIDRQAGLHRKMNIGLISFHVEIIRENREIERKTNRL